MPRYNPGKQHARGCRRIRQWQCKKAQKNRRVAKAGRLTQDATLSSLLAQRSEYGSILARIDLHLRLDLVKRVRSERISDAREEAGGDFLRR